MKLGIGQSRGSRLLLASKAAMKLSVGSEALLLLLLVLTLLVVRFEDTILKREMLIDPVNTPSGGRYTYADEGMNGNSVVRPDPAQPLSGKCVLREGYAYPFCGFGMSVNPQQPEKGLDFSRAEEIRVELTYRGTGELVRLTLKNHDKRYSKINQPETDKMNKADLMVRSGRQIVVAHLADFSIAEWWVQANRIPQTLTGPQFDNVSAVELQTGPDARRGAHWLKIHRIIVITTVLSRSDLYYSLALLWVVAIGALAFHQRTQAEQAHRALAKRGQQTLNAIPQMVWSVTTEGTEYFNGQWVEFTGVELGPASGFSRLDLVHPEDLSAAADRWQHSLRTGDPYESEYRLRHHSGEYRWVLSRGLAEKGAGGEIQCWYGTCTDIHDRVLAALAVEAGERLTTGIINAIPDCVSLLDPNGIRVFANPATVAAYQTSASELLGRCWLERIPENAREEVREALDKAKNGVIGRVTLFGETGRFWDIVAAPVLDAAGTLLRIVVVSRDITEQKAAQERATWTSEHDALTSLPNRKVLQDRLEKLAESRRRDANPFALVLIDVDDFKRINDTAGHDAGDALLCAIAERLQASVRSGDTVSRLSGDEFALLLPGVGTETELRIALERITEGLRKPCVHGGRIFDCNASMGAGIVDRHGSTPTELLKNVDVALYAAKAAGKGNFQIFRSSMRNEMQKRSSMLSLAKDALTDRRIVPYYQPKVDLRSGTILGFEALLRWRHPKKGMQPPAQIAAAFEDLNIAAEISDQIIEQVLHDIVRWRDAGIDIGHVAVNASAAEFKRGGFAERLLEKLQVSEIPVSSIQLEVTETVFLGRGADYVEKALKLLSSAGMMIALDDFGTGYASLSHLNQFPVNILKIDRSFVSAISPDTVHAPIIDAVINLGRSLGMEVVAEGIETEAQHEFLVKAGCLLGQGYLYSPAIAQKRVPALLKRSTGESRLAA